MIKFPTLSFVVAALTSAASSSVAAVILTADITNSQEPGLVVPTTTGGALRPVSFGSATFILNDANTALSFTATIFNIDVTGTQTADTNDNLAAAHIHAGPNVAPGVNGPVVWGFFGSPLNDNSPNDSSVTPFASGVGGVFSGKWDLPEGNNTTLGAQLANILGGRSYINFHTSQFGGGEIRGAITVPDTGATLAMLGFACSALLGLGRKWKK